ncbi:MAG: hypothetical protein KAI50_08740 [Desulfobacterales bacterium]|nr:hypothetical protein [Desulfobacterales bacterium]
MKSFSVNQLFRKTILSCCFITILLIFGTDLLHAHDVRPESMGHHNKASDLFNHLNITLNNIPLDFELMSMFCSHAQTKTFYYKADIPNEIKSPYELLYYHCDRTFYGYKVSHL